MENKLLEIINHYGVSNQQRKLSEEVFELQEAIFNYERKKQWYEEDYSVNMEEAKNHIVEEIADVEVMLLQFKEYYCIDGKDILEIMNKKIDRQLERIKNEN